MLRSMRVWLLRFEEGGGGDCKTYGIFASVHTEQNLAFHYMCCFFSFSLNNSDLGNTQTVLINSTFLQVLHTAHVLEKSVVHSMAIRFLSIYKTLCSITPT